MLEKQIIILEKLLSEKVSEDVMDKYENYKKIKGVGEEELNRLEERYDIKLPDDFREFYKYKNGSGYHFHILYPDCGGEYIDHFICFQLIKL